MYEIKNPLEHIMRQAGDLLMASYHRSYTISYKHGHELVTDVDQAVEHFLIQELKKLVPQAGIIAEESTPDKAYEWNWVIDPIDGTVNFVHHIPHFCISIGLTQFDKPMLAMIYQPITHELYYAIKDGGAYLNEQVITVSQTQELWDAVVGCVLAKGIESVEFWKDSVYSMRHFGAYALDLAYVASARLDCAIPVYFKWWDVVAGMLLVTEAGGQVTDGLGKDITPKSPVLLASNGLLQGTIIKKLSKSCVL